MQEDFLHYLWQFQKWKFPGLQTSAKLNLSVLTPGTHNLLFGPDFLNFPLVIGTQEWTGNVEIHINSSVWYVHGHETDLHYDNVILHVVWNHDSKVYRKDNSAIPVLELKQIVPEKTIAQYQALLEKPSKN